MAADTTTFREIEKQQMHQPRPCRGLARKRTMPVGSRHMGLESMDWIADRNTYDCYDTVQGTLLTSKIYIARTVASGQIQGVILGVIPPGVSSYWWAGVILLGD
jgi:hypothetical protein